MAKEPDDIVLHHLRALRSDVKGLQANVTDVGGVVKDIRLSVAGLDLRFDERVEMLREGTLTAIGFAANASESHKKLREQIVDLTRRVENLEKAK
jgi:hypothetical protein